MKVKFFLFLLIYILVGAGLLFSGSGKFVNLLTIDGPIGPVTSRIITQAIEKAEKENAEALVIELNTPGGLDEATRIITKAILNSPVPVIVYVAPSGSRAASAGVFITMSAHIAAMAPGTNIGAAHPVSLAGQMDSTMAEKAANDAAAYLRSIASKRERNTEFAEEAVMKSKSITEYEALKEGVIDFIASNLRELLDSSDGVTVSLPDGEKVLSTKGVEIKEVHISWRDRILEIISNPTIAYLLLNLGWIGLAVELYNPGSIFPGVIGAICLILGLYGLQTLPVNYVGLILILLGAVLFILEIKVISHGILTVGGIISMLFGSLMLIQSPLPYMRVSLAVIIATVAAIAAFFIFAIGYAIKAQLKKPTTGDKGLIGLIGVARSKLDKEGIVFVHGEIWRAESDVPIESGEKIEVVGIENLTLKVTKKK
jgi:membrane-bound serine protease (ClpP class)